MCIKSQKKFCYFLINLTSLYHEHLTRDNAIINEAAKSESQSWQLLYFEKEIIDIEYLTYQEIVT